MGNYREKTASAIFDAAIETALKYVGLPKSDRLKDFTPWALPEAFIGGVIKGLQ